MIVGKNMILQLHEHKFSIKVLQTLYSETVVQFSNWTGTFDFVIYLSKLFDNYIIYNNNNNNKAFLITVFIYGYINIDK